jgi:outer membrane protein
LKTKFILSLAFLTSIATFSQKQWTLKQCVDQALEKNISIQQNKLNVRLAEKDVAIAKGSFLPNLSFNNSHRGTFGLSSGISGLNTSQDRYNASFSLNTSGNIFNGFRNTNTYKQAQLGIASSRLDLQKIENDISLFVVNGYLNILFAKENLAVARVQAAISKKQVTATNSSFEAGVIPKGDLLNAKSTAANDFQNVIIQENALDIANLNLAQLLQVTIAGFDVSPINVGTPSSDLLYKNSSSVYEKSLSRMPEIIGAELAIENADLNIEISKGSFLPTVSYSAGANTSYFTEIGEPDVRTIFDPITNTTSQEAFGFFKQLDEQLSYFAGISISVPIFNRFQTKNRLAKSKINKEISETRLESEKLQLKQTIEQAFLDVKSGLKTFEAAKISLEAQQEAFKNAQERYNYGVITLFDFDLVRTRLVNAEGAMIRSKYDYVFKTKVLQFYYGDLILE